MYCLGKVSQVNFRQNKKQLSQTDIKVLQKKLWDTGNFIPKDVLTFVLKQKGFKVSQ